MKHIHRSFVVMMSVQHSKHESTVFHDLNGGHFLVQRHTNQVIHIHTLSRRVFAYGKAAKRRCSISTASFDHAIREQTHVGLS
jgi:hypothetical protein